MNPVRILIADDQALMRDGLKTILELERDFEIAGTARNGLEALKLAESLHPDVVLLDIRMPEMDGVESIRLIKKSCPRTIVIMLTTFNDEEYIVEALANGASGYLLKDIEMDKLIEAVRDAAQGKIIIPPAVATKLADALARMNTKKKEEQAFDSLSLSEREKEIASMLVQGFTNKQISSALYISEGTVRNYISGIYGKIGIGDRTQAVIFLRDHGVR